MEYVDRLIQLHYIEPEARKSAQSRRDPPNHGVGLQSAGSGFWA